jgi:L-threonylcarbamoyladenylate synthase
MYPRHYAPRTPVRIARNLSSEEAGITLSEAGPRQIRLPSDPRAYAVDLYAALHRLDAGGYEEILIEAPPEGADWEAVWDRLRRAATPA